MSRSLPLPTNVCPQCTQWIRPVQERCPKCNTPQDTEFWTIQALDIFLSVAYDEMSFDGAGAQLRHAAKIRKALAT